LSRLSHELDGLALDLAWSQWTELGVESGVRQHEWRAIDLEPLIIFTAGLTSDSRLRAASIDWCITNARFASAFRLRNFARQASSRTRAAFGRYAATVKAHAKVPWPGHGDPFTLMLRDQRAPAPDLRRPALVQLRLRALVGVSARAEILKLLLAHPDRLKPASLLAEAAGYGKGSVSQALDMLTTAGFVHVQPSANRLLYRLARPVDMAKALQWLPSVYPDWWPVFRIAEALIEYSHATSGPPVTRMVAIQKVLSEIDADLKRLGITEAVPRALVPASVAEFEQWAVDFLERQIEGHEIAPPGGVAYRVRRLPTGVWEATVSVTGGEPRPLTPETDGGLDVRTSATRLASAMFADALRRNAAAPADDAILRVVSQEFSEELLRPMRPGHEATFTAEFVRRWYENRRQRFGATA
jgi:DNA-binding transcriptional ArsR family regulator